MIIKNSFDIRYNIHNMDLLTSYITQWNHN